VDIVLEDAPGTVIGIEVKATETVRVKDFLGPTRPADSAGGATA
jgi:hypothetical protein